MKTFIIGIAGGTGSGKTTFTNRLKNYFRDDITVIYHDDYYKEQNNLSFEERKQVNYDHPDALQTDLLVEHLKHLKAHEEVEIPIYDFGFHNRLSETRTIKPAKVILVEGILVLQNSSLRKLFDLKLYVHADADERILRRMSRDVNERNRNIQDVAEQYLKTVKPMHELYVEPTKNLADIIINGGLNEAAFDLIKNQIEAWLTKEEK